MYTLKAVGLRFPPFYSWICRIWNTVIVGGWWCVSKLYNIRSTIKGWLCCQWKRLDCKYCTLCAPKSMICSVNENWKPWPLEGISPSVPFPPTTWVWIEVKRSVIGLDLDLKCDKLCRSFHSWEVGRGTSFGSSDWISFCDQFPPGQSILFDIAPIHDKFDGLFSKVRNEWI